MSGDTAPEVWLRRSEGNTAEIDALAEHVGGRAPLSALLDDLDRRARRGWAPGRLTGPALTWDAADRRDPDWWPQGVTTSGDADPSGLVDGRRLMVVSWYSKRGKGARLSFLDLQSRRYRHVLLVDPTLEGGRPGVRPLRVHAGGIAWHGLHLHVAATGQGIAVCRIDDLLRVPAAGQAGLEAYGHRYLLPVRFRYVAETAQGRERFRYSFLSLDHTGGTPVLVAGEYGSRRQTRRLIRFRPGAEHLLTAEAAGTIVPAEMFDGGPPRMQGALRLGERWVATTSHGPWTPGSLWTGAPGAMRRRRWAVPMGPEDLAHDPSSGRLWTVTEHPRRRWIVPIDADRLAR